MSTLSPHPARQTSVRRNVRKLFVGGLAPTVSTIDFTLFFERFGEIEDAVVMVDRDTER